MRIIILFAFIAACSASAIIDTSLEEEWQIFKKLHNKVYLNDKEETIKYKVYKDNRSIKLL